MGEPRVVLTAATEGDLARAAGRIARAWRDAGLKPLSIGLEGDLGAGKTTWVRAMLRGLGYTERVPSPTYTLLEQYPLDGLELVHLDLYRLGDAEELDFIGFRDLLARPDAWIAIEWSDRFAPVAGICDLVVELDSTGESSRKVLIRARTPAGIAALSAIDDLGFK